MNVITAQRHIKPASGLKFEIVTVTPEIAAAWLDTNERNRKLNKTVTTRFARDMSARQWATTGDAIKFSSKGKLLDGQHRLSACIAADASFDTLVVYGIDEASQDAMDTGKARSGGDMLSLHGVKNANNVASTLKLLINEKKQRENFGGNATVTHSEMRAALKKHPRLPLYVASPSRFPRGVSISTIAYVHYVAAALLDQPDLAAQMVEVLATGVPAYDGDPIHRYRERCLRELGHAGGSSQRMARIWTLFHCWNLFFKQESITLLKWRPEPVAIAGLDLKKL